MIYTINDYESNLEHRDDRIWILPMLDDMVRELGDVAIISRMGTNDVLLAAKYRGQDHQDEPILWARIDCWDYRSGVMRVQWTPAEGGYGYVSAPLGLWHEVNCAAAEIPAVLITIFVELGKRRVTMLSVDTWVRLKGCEVRSTVRFSAPPVGDSLLRHRIVWTERARGDYSRAAAPTL
jgi:hypothetical protein